jgi:hypothetical protein
MERHRMSSDITPNRMYVPVGVLKELWCITSSIKYTQQNFCVPSFEILLRLIKSKSIRRVGYISMQRWEIYMEL